MKENKFSSKPVEVFPDHKQTKSHPISLKADFKWLPVY